MSCQKQAEPQASCPGRPQPREVRPRTWGLGGFTQQHSPRLLHAVPDVILCLVVLPGEVAGGALAGDLDHGQLFTVAGQVAGDLAGARVPGALLEQGCGTPGGSGQRGVRFTHSQPDGPIASAFIPSKQQGSLWIALVTTGL